MRAGTIAIRLAGAFLPPVIHGLNIAVCPNVPSVARVLVVTMLLLLIALYVLDCCCPDEAAMS